MLGIVGLAVFAVGGLQRAEPEPLPIVGGEVVEPGAYPEVVALVRVGGSCTGVAVAPNLVLTAAHCVRNLGPGDVVAVQTGDAVDGQAETQSVAFGSDARFKPDPRAADTFDYGFVVTVDALPEPYAVPITRQEEWDFAMQWGREIVVVGYGLDPVSGEQGIKRELVTPINGFSPLGLEFYAGGDGKDSCDGDSGGPVFVVMPDGTRRLAGLVSRGSMICGSRGVYAVPHPALCWIRDASGIDVTGACETCDCIDATPPPRPQEGCGCAAPGDNRPAGWLAVFVLVACRRRRPATRLGRRM